MKTPLLAAAFLTFVSFAYSALNTRTGTVAAQIASIDGVGIPEVSAWSGGEPSASIVLVRSQGLDVPRKTLGPIACEPIIIEASPPFSPVLQNCISEMLGGGSGANLTSPKKTLLLSNLDSTGQPVGETIQATGAFLTEIQFPELDASARTPSRVKLVFHADSTSLSATSAPVAGGGNSRNSTALSSHFLLTFTGLSASGLTRIDAFTIRREVVTHTSGGITRLTPGPITIPDLTLSLAGSAIPEWQTWRNAFFPSFSAQSSPALTAVPYKEGTLQLLSADMRTPLFTLQLSRVGLKRLAQLPVSPNTIFKLRAEIFCESMSTFVGNGLTQPPESVTASPASTPAKVAPREIDPNKTLSTKTLTPAPTAATSAEDKGVRDPADFPRPPDVVRTSFSATREPNSSREIAYYSSTSKAANVIAFYEKSLEADGWKETSRQEDNSGPKGSYRITSNWTKEKRTAQLVLGDIAPEKMEIYVNLQDRK